MRVGRLSDRLKFYSRPVDDAAGGKRRGGWAFEFETWAELQLRPGSEVFAASRIEGRLPVNVRVRADSRTLQIDTGWMAQDAQGRRYAIQAPARDPRDRGAVVFTMVAGVVQ